MTYTTPNHEWTVPEIGEENWGDPLQALIDDLDVRVPTRGLLSDRPDPGTLGRFYYAGDENILYYDTGNAWRRVTPLNENGDMYLNGGVIGGVDEIRVTDGGAGDPAFTFKDDQDTGVYRVSTGTIGITADGTQIATVSATGLDVATGALTEAGTDVLTAGDAVDAATLDGHSAAALTRRPVLAGVDLAAAGGADTAHASFYVAATETFTLTGWGLADETGAAPTDVDRYVYSGDLTGTPTTEYTETTAAGWDTGAPLATVAGEAWVHLAVENTGASGYTGVTLTATYTIE